MKLIAGVILSLALLDLFDCAPLINDNVGSYKESHSSSKWGYTAGVGLDLGLEGGFKNGIASIATTNHLGFDLGGTENSDTQDIEHPLYGAPYDFRSPNFNPNYGRRPQNGLRNGMQAPPPPQYYPQYPAYYPQNYPQYNPQSNPQYNPQFNPQPNPQYNPQSYPQYNPQSYPQYNPQYNPQPNAQSNPQSYPQSNPQSNPHLKGTPINEEYVG